MYEQVEKSKESKSRSVTNSVTQRKIDQGFDFVDNRPDTLLTRQFYRMKPRLHVEKHETREDADNDREQVSQLKHLPFELGHVVQQSQGRVKPATTASGMAVNDNHYLESEATKLGNQALQRRVDNKIESHFFISSNTKQLRDFGKYPGNERLKPDNIGGADGIRQIPAASARPDDVPLKQDYRLAMHKLHNVILVLENADRSPERIKSPSTDKLRDKMVDIQKKGKVLAKDYKTSMRDLESNSSSSNLQETYTSGMNGLIVEISNHTQEGESVIRKHGYVGRNNSLKKKGTNLWRTRWLKAKNAVNSALTSLWGGWMATLKTRANSNKGNDSTFRSWKSRIAGEKWNIFYGGSLMKGYKGPPKQNTRFLASSFDVDANMDAPAIAEYLINKKSVTVDRGQLDPKTAPETRVAEMDAALDKEVKKELLKAELAATAGEIDKIISEPFETRINAPSGLGRKAAKEVKRSDKEQQVRDKLTSIRNTSPLKMTTIGAKLNRRKLLDNVTHGLVSRILTSSEINQISQIIDTT